jgi:hypothetical protein
MPGLTTGFDEIAVARGIRPEYLATRNIIETFRTQPVVVQDDGTAASGVDAENNVMAFEHNTFRLHNLGTQTIIVPILEADGLEIGRDKTVGEGSELSLGILARSPGSYVIGTDAFYLKATLLVADVSGVDELAIGFRKAEAERALIDNYLDMAVLNLQLGNIFIETILNNAATTSTDTTNDWADAASHTLEVYVAKSGAVTYKIDGAAPTVTAAFTFDSGDTVMAMVHLVHAATTPGKVHISRWECGLQ